MTKNDRDHVENDFLEDTFDLDKEAVRQEAMAFQAGQIDETIFIQQCLKTFGAWDSFTRSLTYGQIEAALSRHFCGFWDECADGKHQSSDWQDYAPLFEI